MAGKHRGEAGDGKGFHTGAGMFRRSGTGADSARGGESGSSSTSRSSSKGSDGYPLGDHSGRRSGAGAAGEGTNRSERD